MKKEENQATEKEKKEKEMEKRDKDRTGGEGKGEKEEDFFKPKWRQKTNPEKEEGAVKDGMGN